MLTVRYQLLDLRPGQRVLDLGCGLGRHAYESARRGAHVVALDAAALEVSKVAETFTAMAAAGEITAPTDVLRGDAAALPFADGAFDVIIASEVLEHVADDAVAMAEMSRVTRPGGIVAVTVPAYLPERICWALSDDYHAPVVAGGHVRIYRRSQLEHDMAAAGLAPFAHHRTHALHSPYWWLKCVVGVGNDDNRAVVGYRTLLEREIIQSPRSMRAVERALAPALGKSTVVYARRTPVISRRDVAGNGRPLVRTP
jgi:SAM-dependent methyltransferase